MSSVSSSKLFKPLRIGPYTVGHRVALAPLTRFRAYDDHTPSEIAAEYYEQRASVKGSLLITEATYVAEAAGGMANVPGIYTDKHIEGWRRIADAVHRHESLIFMQIWALGRAAVPEVLAKEPNAPHPYVSSSNVPLDKARGAPRPLTKDEIKTFVGHYADAAENAVKAGIDGVEIHGANGYLIDQFLQTNSNTRSDEYGGSIENRVRFALEVVEAVTKRIGEEKTGIRISPWSTFQGMREADPLPLFSYYIAQLRDRFPKLAYIHLVEPRISGGSSGDGFDSDSNDFALKIWREKDPQRPYLIAGGFTPQSAAEKADKDDVVVVFGRYFISNPDLPFRIKHGIEFEPYNRKTFYLPGPHKRTGYTDYKNTAERESRL